ncbi:uncharacterized protein (DUF302 family) [Bosea sp. 124]|nr:uncharacterized protein (DUF302 family) [Bosea sp. 124]
MTIRAISLALGIACCTVGLPSVSEVRAQAVDGYRVVRTHHSFDRLQDRIAAAIQGNGMNAVTRASASDGAKARGLIIRGDAVIGVFRNDFAIRMLAADIDAGIEAPIRLHLVEEADGGSSIRYQLPSTVFGRYPGDAIKALGAELDPIFERIVSEAAAQ